MTVLPATAPALSCAGISAAYDPKVPVLHDIDACFEPGRFTAVIGPNGSGKSTLLSCLARQLSCQGRIALDDTDVRRMSRRAYAQQVAFLPQSPFAPEGVSVRGLIERGRTPHRRPFAPLSRADHAAVDAAIERLSLSSLAERLLTDLSGGQRQRAWLALVLAQVHTRNPLADPGLLGVTSGAGFAVIAGMAFLGLNAPLQYVWCALVGAALSGALVLLIAGRIRAFGPITTIVLTGAITSALLGAASTAIVLTHEEIMRSFQGWSTGALVNRQLDLLPAVAPLLAAGIVLTLVNLPSWPGLALGDELAAGLGRNVAADRTIGISAIVVLAAAATAITGPLAFIGLLSPHAARRLVPDEPIAAVLLTAPLGAITQSLLRNPLASPDIIGVTAGASTAAVLALASSSALLSYDARIAGGLGIHVPRGQLMLLIAAIGLAAVVTAVAGPVPFVAFAAPQIALVAMRSEGPPVAGGALVGAVMMLAADFAAARLFSSALPVGVVTSFIGIPVLLWLLLRTQRLREH